MRRNLFYDNVNTYCIADKECTTYKKKFVNDNFVVEAGFTELLDTNTRYILSFTNNDSIDMKTIIAKHAYLKTHNDSEPINVKLEFGGEIQLDNIIEGLEFALDIFKRIAKEEKLN